MLRVGICGMGLMGRGYFRIFRENPHVHVTAVCDIDPERIQPAWYAAANQGTASATDDDRVLRLGGQDGAGRTGAVRSFLRFEELCALPDLDVIAVTTPSTLHAPISIAALRAGKHVICEKPMSLSAAACDRMLEAARAAGKTLMVEQCVRFFPQYELIKQYVDQGVLGHIQYAFLQRLGSPPSHSRNHWMLDARQSGGAVYDLHIHDVDFVHELLGAPDTIEAAGGGTLSGGIDHVTATWRYPQQRYAVLSGAWSLHNPWPFDMSITVHGDKGTLHWTASAGPEVLYYNGGKEAQKLPCPNEGGTRRLLAYFIDRVRQDLPTPRCTAASARMAVALADLEVRAIELGGPVEVAESLVPVPA
jgi:predicted dehydrogenase